MVKTQINIVYHGIRKCKWGHICHLFISTSIGCSQNFAKLGQLIHIPSEGHNRHTKTRENKERAKP